MARKQQQQKPSYPEESMGKTPKKNYIQKIKVSFSSRRRRGKNIKENCEDKRKNK